MTRPYWLGSAGVVTMIPPARPALMSSTPVAATRRATEELAQRVFPACLAFFMSGLVSAVVTAINTGLMGGFVWRWLGAWALALPVAVTAAYLVRPVAWRLARTVARLARQW